MRMEYIQFECLGPNFSKLKELVYKEKIAGVTVGKITIR